MHPPRIPASLPLLALLLTAGSVSVHAQTPPAAPDSALSCTEDLSLLDRRIQMDYAGFRLEVKGQKAQHYQRAIADLRARAASTTGGDCYFILKDLIKWFADPHLFLYETSRLDTAETTRRAQTAATLDLDEARAHQYFVRQGSKLDPIEGIWYDGPLRVAVVPDPKGPTGHFVAVVLAPDTTTWRPGAIRARITRRAPNTYDLILWERNYAIHHRDGQIFKHVLLRLSPGIWGKAFPVTSTDHAFLDPTDAHRPTMLVRHSTVIVSVPSHSPEYKPALDSLIAEHAADLLHADRLIVDLRGNEGGGSFMTAGLMPYIASAHQHAGILEGTQTVVLSSDDQIAYAQRALGWRGQASLERLLARMRSHVGEFVSLTDSADGPTPPEQDSVIVGPQRVGILIDRGTVSASEVLVLEAFRSTRVTVFGEPTAGALDYQSTSIVSFSPRERRWYLGYPTLTRSTALPVGGMRGKGIAPAVRIDLQRVADPIAAVEQALNKRP